MLKSDILQDRRVAVTQEKASYCSMPPYDPSELYPEYPFEPNHVGDEDNPAYRAVRNNFILLGLDTENLGKPSWNPLGSVVEPGDVVVIKPNFVMNKHYGGGDIFSIITHPSIIRTVADYCLIALKGKGVITVADAPVEDCDFEDLLELTHMKAVQEAYHERCSIDLNVMDLRQHSSDIGEGRVYAHRRKSLAGDPAGDVIVDLGKSSMLYDKQGPFFGADLDTKETRRNHAGSIHRYQLSKTVLSCDVLISVPKLKVHKKVGATLNLKGMVGVNTNKNFLVHYTEGTPRTGGDQALDASSISDSVILRGRKMIGSVFISSHHPVLEKMHYAICHSRLYRLVRGFLRSSGLELSTDTDRTNGGNWCGNDTCWRMVVDLAHIICFADSDGRLRDVPQRKFFSIVDGIIGGDKNGPLRPRSRPEGVVISGSNPLAVDAVSIRLMGFDTKKLKLYQFMMQPDSFMHVTSEDDISLKSNDAKLECCLEKGSVGLEFSPHHNWVGHIES